MGLDLRLSYKEKYKKVEYENEFEQYSAETICNGQGRAAYNFVRLWVGSERYGDNILLTDKNIEELIDLAVEQETGEDGIYNTRDEFLDACIRHANLSEELYGDTVSLVAYLLVIKGRLSLGAGNRDYYLECDW